MKKTIMMAFVALAVSLSAQEFKIDPGSPNPWKQVRNYNNRVKVESKEIKGKKATLVTFANKDDKQDTAFALIAPDYQVNGKKTVTVSLQILASSDMKVFGSRNPNHIPGIRWYDADGKEIKPMTRFKLPEGNGEFRAFSQTLEVPPTANIASLQIGFDYPDIAEGKNFAVADILITD